MPAILYCARTNRAREQAGAPRQPTSTHDTARAEEKRDRKEEEEKGETRGRVGKRWEGQG